MARKHKFTEVTEHDFRRFLSHYGSFLQNKPVTYLGDTVTNRYFWRGTRKLAATCVVDCWGKKRNFYVKKLPKRKKL